MMSKTPRTTRTIPQFQAPLVQRIGDLKRERDELQEEVLQLKAAVQIWKAVCRQTMTTASVSEDLPAEMQ